MAVFRDQRRIVSGFVQMDQFVWFIQKAFGMADARLKIWIRLFKGI